MPFRTQLTKDKAHEDSIWTTAWTDKNQILSGSVDETVKVWDVTADAASAAAEDEGLTQLALKQARKLTGHNLGAHSLDVSAATGTAAVSSLDCSIRMWDPVSGDARGTIDAGPVETWTVSFSPDGQRLASGSHNGCVNLWGVDSLDKQGSVQTKGNFVMSVAFSPDGTKVVAGGHNGSVSLIDVQTETEVARLEGANAHVKPVRSVSFSADGGTLLTASDDSQINVYDLGAGGGGAGRAPQLLAALSGHTSWVLAVRCRADGQQFATAGSDHTVKVWDFGQRSCLHTFEEHADQVWSVAYSPDGKRLVSGGEDGKLNVYDVA